MNNFPHNSLVYVARTALVLALGGALVACAPTRSKARPSSVEYTPDTGDKTAWDLEYDDDGYLERVTRELDGDRVSRVVYGYDNGKLVSMTTQFEDPEWDLKIEYTWDGDKVVSASGSGDVDIEGEGATPDQKITFDISGEYEYDGSRPIAGTVSYEIEQSYGEAATRYVSTTTNEESYDYEYDDNGRIVESVSEARTDTEVKIGDGDPLETTSRSDTTTKLEYDDDGNLASWEAEAESKYEDEDTQRTTTTGELKFEDSVLVEGEWDVEYEGGDFSQDIEIEYDDDGRIERIEDGDGNRWDYEYADDDAKGVTVAPAGIPTAEFFDLTGKGFYSDVRIDHISLP